MQLKSSVCEYLPETFLKLFLKLFCFAQTFLSHPRLLVDHQLYRNVSLFHLRNF